MYSSSALSGVYLGTNELPSECCSKHGMLSERLGEAQVARIMPVACAQGRQRLKWKSHEIEVLVSGALSEMRSHCPTSAIVHTLWHARRIHDGEQDMPPRPPSSRKEVDVSTWRTCH